MSIDKAVTLTAEGKADLEEKLAYLKRVKRPEIAQKIGQAADDGDLSENGAYHNAKEEQGRLEGQIAELEYILKNALIARDTGDAVGIGKHVTVEDETGSQKTYRLVSSHEVNATLGFISDKSPIGSALMGARAGDVVEAQTPGRSRRFKVLSVK
ncbi:MAG TPA: transcription elongation factor GreA [Chloroflexota bacterium]|nr:transcription elongation factor GreA [Chloroflexota bacterium]